MNEQNWSTLKSEQRKVKLERAVIGIALELMQQDSYVTKAEALTKAQAMFGRGKTHPKGFNNG